MIRIVLILVVLLPSLAEATTYYTSKSTANGFAVGNDSNNCTALSTPCLTVTGAILNKMAAGDTLRINDGVYAEELTTIPSSSSYAAATQIQGYLGSSSSVTIQPSVGATRALTLSNKRYIIISDIIFDGDNASSDAVKVDSASDHVRFVRVEIKNGTNQGMLWSASSYIECLSCTAHHNGSNTSQHGIYIGDSDNCLVQGGSFYSNAGGGVHIASGTPTGNIIEKVRTYSNTWGLVDADENSNTWRNNLVYSNTSHGINIVSVTSSFVYNNTVYGNGGIGVWSETDTSGILLKNNIVYNNTGGNISLGGTGHTQTTNLTTDPSFTNAVGGDFTLQTGSAARDAGTNLAPDVTDDYAGVARPQNGTYDTGAYEYVVSGGSGGGMFETPSWSSPRRHPLWRR